jgi:hypothetical protein
MQSHFRHIRLRIYRVINVDPKHCLLKGQCHEIFDPRFFRQSITPRPLINTPKYFRILFRIRRAIRPLSFIPRYAMRGIKIFYIVAPILKLYFVGYM